MRVLLIGEANQLTQLTTKRLETDGHAVAPSCWATLGALQGDVHSADAAIYLSTGWDQDSAARDEAWRSALLSAMRGSGKRLVYLSDASVVGDTGGSFGNEDDPRSLSLAPHSWRVTAEQQIMRAVSTGIHSIVIRPALLHGHDSGTVLRQLLKSARTERSAVYIGDGQHRTSTVHVDDLTRLISLSVTRAPEAATYFAASTEVLSWREVAETVSRIVGDGCNERSVTAAEASNLGLDAATLATTTVIRDDAAHRRLGWTATGPTLAAGERRSERKMASVER
jgi:nucleoside-diphosphate-sugar epimerase